MKMQNTYTYAVLAISGLVIQPLIALAADTHQEKPVVLEKIVVTDKRPFAGELTKTEVDEKEISHRQAQVQDTAKLLEDIPGVSLQAGGGMLYHMMPFNTKLSLDHQLGGWKNALEMQFVDSKDNVQAIRNELRTPSYILLNAKTGYQWKNLSIDVGLDNVLNKQYYHPLGGAYTGDYYAMSITMPDKGFTNNRNLPGMGPSVYVGVNLTY